MKDSTLISGDSAALTDEVRVNCRWIGGMWDESAETFERVSPSHDVVVSRSAKQSGLGRQTGRYGLDQFMEIKIVAMQV